MELNQLGFDWGSGENISRRKDESIERNYQRNYDDSFIKECRKFFSIPFDDLVKRVQSHLKSNNFVVKSPTWWSNLFLDVCGNKNPDNYGKVKKILCTISKIEDPGF